MYNFIDEHKISYNWKIAFIVQGTIVMLVFASISYVTTSVGIEKITSKAYTVSPIFLVIFCY